MGPAVSCVLAIGMMPLRLTRPIEGFNPTRDEWTEGLTMEPDVSVPTAARANPAATPAAQPLLEPPTGKSGWK